ncbi:unnamed protein product, partial [Brenthis ino]
MNAQIMKYEEMPAPFILLLVSVVKAITELGHLPMPIAQPYQDQQSYDFGYVFRKDFKKDTISEDFPELELSKLKEDYVKEAPKDSLTFLSPRDEIQHYKSRDISKYREIYGTPTSAKGAQKKTMREPIVFDFSKLLERNIAYPLAGRRKTIFNTQRTIPTRNHVNISQYFEQNAFYRKTGKKIKKNWTTCDEFVKKAVFHPDDIINTKWLPFYIWSERGLDVAVVHTFTYPTKKTVQHFKTTYGPYIKKVNWFEPKLLLREKREMLLIAGDRRGLFYGISGQELPSSFKGDNMTLPLITLRMKIHDPYLVLMYCDTHYATIMAELNTGPDTDRDKIREAETLQFKGNGKPAFRDLDEEKLEIDLHIDYLKYILEGHVLEPIDWSAKSLLMTERNNRTYFLVEQSDRGHYLLYEPYKGLKEGDIIDAVDVRIKQTGDNRYIGIMACEAQTVFMFARVNDVPKRKYIQIEAARLNYKGRGGRSYLYQGHQWMPMPEAEDHHFEHALNNRDKYSHN